MSQDTRNYSLYSHILPLFWHRSSTSSIMLWWHSAHMSYIQVVGHRKVLDNFMSRKVIDFSVIWYSAYDFLSVSFYRAMLCIRGTSHGPVSVCPSVSQFCPSVSDTSQSSTNTAKQRITQTTPHDSPGTLAFWYQRSPRNSTGVTPYEGAECRWGGQNRRLSTNHRLYLENGKR